MISLLDCKKCVFVYTWKLLNGANTKIVLLASVQSTLASARYSCPLVLCQEIVVITVHIISQYIGFLPLCIPRIN